MPQEIRHDGPKFSASAKAWLYSGKAAWCFVSLPTELASLLAANFADQKHGWGSLPVTVTIGETTWKTSIFPDKKSATYLLPLKADIRKKENIVPGDTISFSFQVLLG